MSKSTYLRTSYNKYEIDASKKIIKGRLVLLDFLDTKLKEKIPDDNERKYQLNLVLDALFAPTRNNDFIGRKDSYRNRVVSPGIEELLFLSLSQVVLKTKGEKVAFIPISYEEITELIEDYPEVLFTLMFQFTEKPSRFSVNQRETSGYIPRFDDYFEKAILSTSSKTPAKQVQIMHDKLWQITKFVAESDLIDKEELSFRFKLYRRQPMGLNPSKTIDFYKKESKAEESNTEKILSHSVEFNPMEDREVAKALYSVMNYMLKNPDTFLIGSYQEYESGPRTDFLHADVYGLYDASYVKSSKYATKMGGTFFFDKYKDDLESNGYYTEAIIGDWSGMEGWFAPKIALFKFFEEGELIPFNAFTDHEEPNNAAHFTTSEEYILFRLALYFADLYDKTGEQQYDIFNWESHGDSEIIIGFDYHDFTTTEQWTEWKDPSKRFKMYSFEKS